MKEGTMTHLEIASCKKSNRSPYMPASVSLWQAGVIKKDSLNNGRFATRKTFGIIIIALIVCTLPLPVWAFQVSSDFGWRIHPISHHPEFHRGVDVPVKSGSPIVALFDGIVVYADTRGGYGLTIIIRHDLKNKIYTLYGHNSVISVIPGQRVKAGDVIGRAGSTGYSTGSHLHLEYWVNGRYVDPLMIWQKTKF